VRHLLNLFYKTFIHPVDPGLFMTRYAAKSVGACLTALILAYLVRVPLNYLHWCMYGAVAVVLFRSGSTFSGRKKAAAILLAGAVVTVPLASYAGSFQFLSLLYIFIAAFAAFIIPALGVSASILGLGLLVINLLSVFSPADFMTGVTRSCFVLLGGVISYIMIFYVWPIRPENILLRAGTVALGDMAAFFNAVARYSGRSGKVKELASLHEVSVLSLRRYRRYLEAMSIDPMKEFGASQGPAALYSLLVRMLEAVVGLSNSSGFARNESAFDDLKSNFNKQMFKAAESFDLYSKSFADGAKAPDIEGFYTGVNDLEEELLNLGAYRRGDHPKQVFLEAWGAIYAMRNVVVEFEQMSKIRFAPRREFAKHAA
jgi:hypothetical protein